MPKETVCACGSATCSCPSKLSTGRSGAFSRDAGAVSAGGPASSLKARRQVRGPLLDEDELFARALRAWLRSCDVPVQPRNDRNISADGNTITLSNVNGTLALYRAARTGGRVIVRRVSSAKGASARHDGRRAAKPAARTRHEAARLSEMASRHRLSTPLMKVRRDFPFDERRFPIDAEIAPLVRALNATGWIVTVGSCSGVHEGAMHYGRGYVQLAVSVRDVLRLSTLLNRLQYAFGEAPAWLFDCSLVIDEEIGCCCDPDEFPDVAFFEVSFDLLGVPAPEGKRQLLAMAELIPKLA